MLGARLRAIGRRVGIARSIHRQRQSKDLSGDWEPVDRDVATEIERTPLLRSSRQERVSAIELMPLLIAKLQDEAQRVVKAIEQAKKIAESLD